MSQAAIKAVERQAKELRGPIGPPVLKSHLGIHDVANMEATATNLRDRLLVRLTFRTGCRISEILAIAVEDTRRSDAVRIVRRKKQRTSKICPLCNTRLAKPYTYCSSCGSAITTPLQKTTGSPQIDWLPIDKETMKLIRKLIKEEKISTGPIFLSQNNAPLSRVAAYYIIRGLASRAGIGALESHGIRQQWNVSPHRLRDALAIHAVEQDDSGEGIRTLQEQLGHSNIKDTMRYVHISGQKHRSWYDNIFSNGEPDAGPSTDPDKNHK